MSSILQIDITFDELVARFVSLFPNRNDSLVSRPHSGNWRQMSRYHHLSDAEIVDSIQTNALLVRACKFDDRTRHLVMQIPAASRYHSAEDLATVKQALDSLPVKARLYRIAEDWYLYIFLGQWVDYDQTSGLLRNWLVDRGFVIGHEGIIVHPSNSAVPLPLQPGFVWFNDKLQPILRRDEVSTESALSLFMSDVDKYSIDADVFYSCLLALKRHDSTSQLRESDQTELSLDAQLQTVACTIEYELAECTENAEHHTPVVETVERFYSNSTHPQDPIAPDCTTMATEIPDQIGEDSRPAVNSIQLALPLKRCSGQLPLGEWNPNRAKSRAPPSQYT